jgi:uncharacterized protein involved in exopolysaccharide biosynthesis
MTIIDFVRLILKHLVLLLLVPILLAILVISLTRNPTFEYSSQTTLYTGLASGSSIEMNKAFNYQATNTAFDNLINIINSRETQEEVAVRLLALHLMLPEANSKYISQEFYNELKLKVPEEIYAYIEIEKVDRATLEESRIINNPLPPEIDRLKYEKTVQNLLELMRSSSDNYIYELLSFDSDNHYSIKAVSGVQAQRISNSDLIKLSYTANDPGICQHTLAIYNEVCTINYKEIKENSSDAVVKYFENELGKAKIELKEAENKLLEFNKKSNIINYYEQSKAVAVVKEELEVDYKQKIAELAGIRAGSKRLEEKLQMQEIIQTKSNTILEKKKELGDLKFKIGVTNAKIESGGNQADGNILEKLKARTLILNAEIKNSVDELYTYQNSIDGLPISKILPDWMASSVETEDLKAKIKVIEGQKEQFQETYANYAPAGANMKRLEREISVAEQGYLEILYGLNLAKLKLTDSELSANLKTVDAPFYPLTPNPTKRSILIIAAAFVGAILTLGIIFIMEYFDDTLRNSIKATKKTGLESLGMMPKIILNASGINLEFIKERLTSIIVQNILQHFGKQDITQQSKTIVVFSTQKLEGKTVLAGNIAKTLKKEGKKVLFMNYEGDGERLQRKIKLPILSKIFGYPDPRIDYENSFLSNPSNYLDASEYFRYTLDNAFYNSESYTDILAQDKMFENTSPDYVIIELPAIIYNKYPVSLITNAGLDIMVCRSNRVWTNADEAAVKNIKESSASKLGIIVNGVQINETESVLGDLPKTRNKFRKKLKSMFRFQFLSKNQI